MSITTNNAVQDVCDELHRQQSVLGYTESHDDLYKHDELPRAAAVYALNEWKLPQEPEVTFGKTRFIRLWWPWDTKFYKPKSRRENMVRAAALLIAEIQRIDRAAS